jgi:hypothetical protein
MVAVDSRPALSYATYDMTVRINARVDKKLADRIAAIRRRTGKSLTEVIEESLAQYCESHVAESPADILDTSGFIGCADGPPELSARYKDELRRGLGKKA